LNDTGGGQSNARDQQLNATPVDSVKAAPKPLATVVSFSKYKTHLPGLGFGGSALGEWTQWIVGEMPVLQGFA